MKRTPVLFVSHGSPMFAIEPGQAGPRLAALGRRLPRPQAVLVVSPHWMTREPRVAVNATPQTVHDFGGFDPALYRLQYPAPGHPALAVRALTTLRDAGWAAEADLEQGLDHGAWVPLLHLLPQADVPVFQVSLPAGLDATQAYAFGRALASLGGEGVMIVGSGSLTHNLREIQHGHDQVEPYAVAFAAWIAQTLGSGDHARLQRVLSDAPHAMRAHPTTEHLWPLLIAAGAAGPQVPALRVEGGVTHGVLSMDAYVWGAQDAGTST